MVHNTINTADFLSSIFYNRNELIVSVCDREKERGNMKQSNRKREGEEQDIGTERMRNTDMEVVGERERKRGTLIDRKK